MIERAIVLAAGFGKRVLPLTNTTPKPLLKINNISLLENTLNFLKKSGVKSFAINTHHLGDQIVAFVEKNKNIYDIKIFKETRNPWYRRRNSKCIRFFSRQAFYLY
jgi:N-acetyl-alpha-D-muramate 1-phosphate uridylyltransferase